MSNNELIQQAIKMGYSPSKVRDIAVVMGLDVEAVVMKFAQDYVEYMLNVAFG